jgi:hypothetical protein
LDPIKLQRAGVYIPLDARELLDRICQNGAPDRQRFYDVIGLLISSASNSWGSVRVFGEMVNLLWKDAKRAEALALENLWNELKKTYPFALFCAYSKDGSLEDDACFAHICEAHSMVIR